MVVHKICLYTIPCVRENKVHCTIKLRIVTRWLHSVTKGVLNESTDYRPVSLQFSDGLQSYLPLIQTAIMAIVNELDKKIKNTALITQYQHIFEFC